MNTRSAMETFGNVSCSSPVCIDLARSDGDEHPLHLAKVTKCTISSGKQQTADLHCTCLSHAVLNFECCYCLNSWSRLPLQTHFGCLYKHQFSSMQTATARLIASRASSQTSFIFIWRILWIYQDSGVNAPPPQKCTEVGGPFSVVPIFAYFPSPPFFSFPSHSPHILRIRPI